MRTKIKICGLTNIKDALKAAELGADALGFVFAPSKRTIHPLDVKKIIKRLPPFIITVGVFMDAPRDEVDRIAEYTGIDVIQLHGKEPPGYCDGLKKRVIKRISVRESDTTEALVARMENYRVSATLLDPGAGSGKAFDWSIAKGIDHPLIIAGGLNPDNVQRAVNLLKPYGIDVSSGVEKCPGKKDKQKVKQFICEVRSIHDKNI